MNTPESNAPLPRGEAAEIELSPEDVMNMCRPRDAVSAAPVRTTSLVPARVEDAHERRARRKVWRQPIALACAGAVSFLAIGAAYRGGTTQRQPATTLPSPMSQPQVAEPALEQREPVRIQNPFDKSEVFEFPPGTSEQTARDTVANTLFQRASGRQARWDSRHARQRRSK
jgi:hypothetical protein